MFLNVIGGLRNNPKRFEDLLNNMTKVYSRKVEVSIIMDYQMKCSRLFAKRKQGTVQKDETF